MGDPEHSFEPSKKNPYDLVPRNEQYADAEANATAQSLAHILRAEKYWLSSRRTLHILDNDYQAVTMAFRNPSGETCSAEISIPLDFAGGIRIWTNNRQARRVWSTIAKLVDANADPIVLFKFLAQRFDEITQEQENDLPF